MACKVTSASLRSKPSRMSHAFGNTQIASSVVIHARSTPSTTLPRPPVGDGPAGVDDPLVLERRRDAGRERTEEGADLLRGPRDPADLGAQRRGRRPAGRVGEPAVEVPCVARRELDDVGAGEVSSTSRPSRRNPLRDDSSPGPVPLDRAGDLRVEHHREQRHVRRDRCARSSRSITPAGHERAQHRVGDHGALARRQRLVRRRRYTREGGSSRACVRSRGARRPNTARRPRARTRRASDRPRDRRIGRVRGADAPSPPTPALARLLQSPPPRRCARRASYRSVRAAVTGRHKSGHIAVAPAWSDSLDAFRRGAADRRGRGVKRGAVPADPGDDRARDPLRLVELHRLDRCWA